MKTTEEYLNDVREFVASKLDWNLSCAEIISYRITSNWRLQVGLIDRCPRGAGDTREYLEGLTDLADKQRIDLIVLHDKP